MTLTPSTFLFEALVRNIPRSSKWSDKSTTDTLNSGHGQQGYLSAFFTSDLTNETMHTMPFQNAVSSSALMEGKNKYFVQHRPTLICRRVIGNYDPSGLLKGRCRGLAYTGIKESPHNGIAGLVQNRVLRYTGTGFRDKQQIRINHFPNCIPNPHVPSAFVVPPELTLPVALTLSQIK